MSLLDEMNKAGVANKKPSLLSDMGQANPLDGFSSFNKPAPKSAGEKFADFGANIIGGGKLAEGLGQAIAAPEITKSISESERQTEALQQQILKRIREKKARGEDTSKLEKTLTDSMGFSASLTNLHKDFEDSLVSDKEVIGSATRLAGTLAGGAIARGASSVTGAGAATGVVSGVVRGAGAGALAGGIEGGIQGAGLAAEADKSSEEILKLGLIGAGSGAVVGGAVGGVLGGITGFFKGRVPNKEKFAEQLVAPKQTPKVRAEAIQQGRLQDPTLFGKAEIQASKHDKTLATAVQDIVNPKATLGHNVDAIRFKVSELNSGVGDYIDANKVPFNMKQLASKLNTGNEDLRLIFASDANAEKTYKAVTKAFLNTVEKGDTKGLFDARQSFDKIPAIRKLLETDKLGENARKEIVLAVRRAANEYIASQLPKGNQYLSTLKNETYLLEALENLAEKSVNIIGKNKLQLLTEEFPMMKWLIGGAAAGAVGAAGIGVGSAIIGSTD